VWLNSWASHSHSALLAIQPASPTVTLVFTGLWCLGCRIWVLLWSFSQNRSSKSTSLTKSYSAIPSSQTHWLQCEDDVQWHGKAVVCLNYFYVQRVKPRKISNELRIDSASIGIRSRNTTTATWYLNVLHQWLYRVLQPFVRPWPLLQFRNLLLHRR
jgi:hypothetical protein